MRGQTVAGDGDLTFLGRVMGQLPIDVCLSKFIVLGHLFSCLKDCIIIGTLIVTINISGIITRII